MPGEASPRGSAHETPPPPEPPKTEEDVAEDFFTAELPGTPEERAAKARQDAMKIFGPIVIGMLILAVVVYFATKG